MEELQKRANDLLVYYDKMQNRLSDVGVADTSALVELFSQLHKGLESISNDELDPAINEVDRLVAELRKMQADLKILQELKTRMAAMAAGLASPASEGASEGASDEKAA